MSTYFLRTLRDDPADAVVPSHTLLVRAGYIRRTAPGIYTWLPLGLRVLRKIEGIVREEMDRIGGQEVLFSGLLPREPYEVTHRWNEYGNELFRLKDRKGADMLLGPTHEEMFATQVKDMYTSYKDFPVTLYQIQTKYRDEERPRAGILRGREFLMCDSYSFDMDDAGLDISYQAHREAYQRIFDRLGLKYYICSAVSGAMGGSRSEEFLAVSDVGEDTFVLSTGGDYAANVEAVITPASEALPVAGQPEMVLASTPDCDTIDKLVAWGHASGHPDMTASHILKCMVVKITHPLEDSHDAAPTFAAVLLPADRAADMKRLEASLAPAEVALADDDDFAAVDYFHRGYIGPRVFGEHGLTVYADPRVVEGTQWVIGADKPEHHYLHAVCGRDFFVDRSIECAEIREGDVAPNGVDTLTLERGIEIGHIFQLGRKYTNAFELDILDENGQRVRPTMGSYGIGVSRLVAVIAEQMHDDIGLRWPVALAPFPVHVVIAKKDDAAIRAASDLVEALDRSGIEVLFDDRPKLSAGVKFKDAELLGMPFIVIFGRGFAEGTVEIRQRGGSTKHVPAQDVERILREEIQAALRTAE